MDNGYRKKVRGFGALILGGILGMAVSALGLIYGYYISAGDLLLIWVMLFGSILCRYFVDSSIATASLGMGPQDLLNDLNLMG